MSIIHEALKKVQSSLQKQTPNDNTNAIVSSMTPESDITPPPKPINWLLIISSIVLIGVGGYFIYQQTNKNMPQIRQLISKAHPAKPLGPLAKITATAPALAPTSSNAATADEFNVQGIMSNNGTTVALINGKIYSIGDSIDGITIADINTNAITLNRDGKEEIIRVRH